MQCADTMLETLDVVEIVRILKTVGIALTVLGVIVLNAFFFRRLATGFVALDAERH